MEEKLPVSNLNAMPVKNHPRVAEGSKMEKRLAIIFILRFGKSNGGEKN
jgi:hypothetical protein